MTVSPSPQKPQPPEKSAAIAHLEGVWISRGANGNSGQMIFAPDGTLTFKNSLTFYNPAAWTLDESRHELHITLPNADYDRLQVFQMAVGDGVKAFNPSLKQITYDFTLETWSLPVAGWTYSKADSADSPARQEVDSSQ
jgi:hypothetical protein